jgi:hypothetical protein
MHTYMHIHDARLHHNPGRQLRAPSDKFGRSITKIRHLLTDEDRRPLPTVRKWT